MDDSTHQYRFELARVGPAGRGRSWYLVTCLRDGEPEDFEPRMVCVADADVPVFIRRVCDEFRHLDLRVGIVREVC